MDSLPPLEPTKAPLQKKTISLCTYSRKSWQWHHICGVEEDLSYGWAQQVHYMLMIGFILLILPFSFAYLMEYQKQAAKIMGGKIINLLSSLRSILKPNYAMISLHDLSILFDSYKSFKLSNILHFPHSTLSIKDPNLTKLIQKSIK